MPNFRFTPERLRTGIRILTLNTPFFNSANDRKKLIALLKTQCALEKEFGKQLKQGLKEEYSQNELIKKRQFGLTVFTGKNLGLENRTLELTAEALKETLHHTYEGNRVTANPSLENKSDDSSSSNSRKIP